MSSNHSSTYSAQSIQPKFKDCQLAATATKTQLRSWVNLVASVVSNLDDGNPLQSFVDGFTGRSKQKANFRPAFLDDPRLQDDSEDITSADSMQNANATDVDSQMTTSEAQSGVAQPTVEEVTAYRNYKDLPEESILLDKRLHSTLLTVVKGVYFDIIANLQGNDARYSYAIIALWKHAALDDSSRRISAMSAMEKVPFNGDGAKWKVDFVKAVREVYDSKLTLEHWIMHCALKAFEGKNSQVQACSPTRIPSYGIH